MNILKILDDCGDTSTIEDWGELDDGLNPVDNQVYVKEGSHSMALGIDADLSELDRARWVNVHVDGDLTAYQHEWLYVWIYFPTLDYLATGTAALFTIGSGAADRAYFNIPLNTLSVGWNLLKFDLDNPSGVTGSPNWAAIDYKYLMIYEAEENINDFTIYVDSLMFVHRENVLSNILKDVLD